MVMSAAVASDPVITSLNNTSSTSVRVEWSQSSGGATATGYVVHYSDGDTDKNESVPASSTSSLIIGLTINITYNFSVEATSEHLSGESGSCTVIMGNVFKLLFISNFDDIGTVFCDEHRYSATCTPTAGIFH